MIAGYHTAGLLLHDPCVAIGELAHLGFGWVAIRPHPCSLHPTAGEFSEQVLRFGAAIQQYHLRAVLDLDAPYFDDPWRSDGPSLVAGSVAERRQAWEGIRRWLDVADELGVQIVTFASGASEDSSQLPEQELDWLAGGMEKLLAVGAGDRVQLALRPRHGDAISSVAQFERFGQWLDPAAGLRLAADIGEMLAGGELPVADRLARNLASLACVYLCDRKAGVSGDLPIGQGDVAVARILRSLGDHQYSGPAIIRVEGHSELGLSAARGAMEMYASAVPD